MASSIIIQLKGVKKTLGGQPVLQGVDLDLPKGDITTIIGPSGEGKSVLLKHMIGLMRPDQGQVLVDGINLSQTHDRELNEIRKKFSMLFQSAALFDSMNVFDNVAFPLREHTNLSETMIRDLVYMKLHAVGLRGARALMPQELSGGMQRRAALARTIALDPSIILYDEPFAGQDPISMGMLVQLIRLLNDALGMTTVIVSHDVAETCSIADYAYVVADGRVIGSGTPQELMNSDSSWIRQFMQGLPDGPVPFHYPAQDYKTDLMDGKAQ